MTLPMSLIALAIASFGIGTTEFVIMGLLPDVATDLRVSIPAAGLLIGGYALSVTIGGPVMALSLGRLPRKTALLVLMGVFTVGNVLCAVAPNYGFLMAARLLTALAHGTFFGIGSVVATSLVPPAQRARAVSIVFSGLTLANILGVPAGTALGQYAGWRATFLAIVPIGLLAIVALWRWLPQRPAAADESLARQIRILRNPAVLLPMAVSSIVSGTLFATFTYITPILQTASGISPRGVTAVLLVFGVAITLGNLIGGRLADWRQLTTILSLTSALVVVLLVFGAVVTSPMGATAAVAAWGLVQFACAPSLQMRVVDGARDAPNLASTLNQSAFNLGNAVGAWIGAQSLELGLPYDHLPLISAALASVAVLVTLMDAMLTRRRTELALA
jgi:MFS transporter, DHA1 family, inner membrane transport protein